MRIESRQNRSERIRTISTSSESENEGTLILDATCAPQNIKYPQDIELLNESREKLEQLIDRICEDIQSTAILKIKHSVSG